MQPTWHPQLKQHKTNSNGDHRYAHLIEIIVLISLFYSQPSTSNSLSSTPFFLSLLIMPKMLRFHFTTLSFASKASSFLPLSPISKVIPHSVRLRSQMASFSTSSSSKLLFRQLFEKESSTYTYLLADASHPQKPALVSVGFV